MQIIMIQSHYHYMVPAGGRQPPPQGIPPRGLPLDPSTGGEGGGALAIHLIDIL